MKYHKTDISLNFFYNDTEQKENVTYRIQGGGQILGQGLDLKTIFSKKTLIS